MRTNTIEVNIMSHPFFRQNEKYKANDWKRVFVKSCIIAGVGGIN